MARCSTASFFTFERQDSILPPQRKTKQAMPRGCPQLREGRQQRQEQNLRLRHDRVADTLCASGSMQDGLATKANPPKLQPNAQRSLRDPPLAFKMTAGATPAPNGLPLNLTRRQRSSQGLRGAAQEGSSNRSKTNCI